MATIFPLHLPEFEPGRQIGSGGFGQVWLARQPNLDRDVAIKIGHTPLDTPATKRRFERECIALGRLSSHNGIVDVYTSGVSDDGLPYLVMEYIEAGSLADRLGQLDETALRKVGVQLCSALSAAHDLGIFHRDLKPANVFMRASGDAVVGDFGIARLGDGNNTTTNQVVASVAYVAPEILDGSPPSAEADIYGIGVTLATVLVGRSPFSSSVNDTASSIIQRVISGRHEGLSAADISPDLSDLLERTLSVDPSWRPSVAELQQMLSNEPGAELPKFVDLNNEAVIAPLAVHQTGPNMAHTQRAFRSTSGYTEPSSNRLVIGALAAVAVLTIGAGLFFVLRDSSDSPGASLTPIPQTTTAISDPSPTTTSTVPSTTTQETEPETSVEQQTDPTTSDRVDATDITADVQVRPSERVRFTPGTSSASIEGAVVSAERDVYLLEAQAGQSMLVELTSLQDNASFTLIAPDNTIITTEAWVEEVILPLDGDYIVVVAPSPGDATYSMNFAIE